MTIPQTTRSDPRTREFANLTSTFVQTCPARLYDMKTHQLITRNELRKRLHDELWPTLGSVPTFTTSEQFKRDLKAQLRSSAIYAVLSHRWTDDELVFQELRHGLPPCKHEKFSNFCRIAQDYGCRYAWVDTVCIDKSSSSELDESIRSMFSWYKHARVCIVYLGEGDSGSWGDDSWFSRGWTLQELLAPKKLVFFLRDWSRLSPKGQFDIVRREADVKMSGMDINSLRQVAWYAGIETDDLISFTPSPKNATKIFNYVARRSTTIPEDISYCLAGLLDVTLPIAYGEGRERSFHRLQVACVESYNDRSVFTWNIFDSPPSQRSSMLAGDPDAYCALCPRITPNVLWQNISEFVTPTLGTDQSFCFTNCGLRIAVTLHDVGETSSSPTDFWFTLHCKPKQRVTAVFPLGSHAPARVDLLKIAILGSYVDEKRVELSFAILLRTATVSTHMLPIATYERVRAYIVPSTLPSLGVLTHGAPETVYIM
ncbi:hypothetical protein ONZ45_g11933 [Pleurotus djamor]|nr:hypothetical protein ONZ45_g11933 [Pleurotus djamor]